MNVKAVFKIFCFTNEVGTKVCKMSLVLGQCDCDDLHTCTWWGGASSLKLGKAVG